MNVNHPPKIKNFEDRVKQDPTIRDKYIKKVHTWDSKRTDNRLKLCKSCKKVWESCKRTSNNRTVTSYNYYDDFPTIGKVREICPKCRVQEDES